MKGRLMIAAGVQLLAIALVLVQPLWVRTTGTVVYLETEKMDPRSLFRGDYVILGYQLAQEILTEHEIAAARMSQPVYVVITTDYPAAYVAHAFERPELQPNQACLVGRIRGWGGSVDFPQIAQAFVPEGTGRAIELQRGDDLLARVATSTSCKGVLLGLEPKRGMGRGDAAGAG